MKRAIPGPAAVILLLPLFAVLALPVYAVLLVLLVVLPPVLLGVTFTDAKAGRGPRDLGGIAARVFAALVAVPLVLLAAIAPIRALLVGTLGFYPPALSRFHEAHEFLYWPVVAAYGDFAPFWLDLHWGIYGVLVIFVLAVFDSIRRNMLIAQIRNLPTSKARSVAVGLAELTGRAVPLAGADPSKPIIRSWLEHSGGGYALRTHIRPFHLDDGTGRILIDARGSEVGPQDDAFSMGLHQVKLTRHAGPDGLPESRLMPGDTVFVLGSVQINDDKATQREDPLVVKPKRAAWLRLDFYDIFFLGSGGERGLIEAFARSIHRGWTAVLMLMALTGWLAIQAWTNIVQLEAMELEAAPPAFRLVSPPTVLERVVEVPTLGRRPVIRWLAYLSEENEGKHAVMEALHRARLARLAMPTLLERAGQIDHADFGVANYWLMALRAVPEGHWGFEYYGKNYEGKREPAVFRVLLQRKGERLLASYDAYFSEIRPAKSRLSATRVVLVLKDVKTGSEHAVSFDARPGWNRERGVEAFASLPRGEYRFRIYPRREYGGNFYDTGPLSMPEVRIVL